jgi:Na+/H+-translocating membrane pyrophosphatase
MRRLTLYAVLWTAATTMVYAMLLPAHYVEAYPVIPIFLYALAVMAHRVVAFFERQGARNLIMIYLVVKMLKLVLSVIGLLIYCLVATCGVKEFVIAFLVNYVFYLVVETSLLVTYKLKKQ